MGLRYKFQGGYDWFFVTTTFKDHQSFCDYEGVYQAIGDSLQYCLNKFNADLIGYVFMPSHIHLIIRIKGKSLSSFMRDFKNSQLRSLLAISFEPKKYGNHDTIG